MLSKKTRKQIKEHKWNKHSNKAQFFKRIREQTHAAFKDLTLIADNMDEEQIKDMFNVDTLQPFINSITNAGKDKDRKFFVGIVLLKYSLNFTGSMFDNRWARALYHEHEMPLREIASSKAIEKAGKSQGKYPILAV